MVKRMTMREQAQKRSEKPLRRFRRKIGEREPHPVPVSSYPEIEEEIEQHGGGIDESRLKIEAKPPAQKPIVSVNGCDIEDERQRDKAA